MTRKRRSVFASLLSTLLLIAVLAGAALYAAIAFKDRDERLKAVADYAEPYVDQASGAFDELKNRLGALLGEKASTQTHCGRARGSRRAAPPEPVQLAPAKPAETAAKPTPTEPRPDSVANAAVEAQNAAVAALQSRVDAAEAFAQRALRAAEAAEEAANAARTAAEAAAKARPAADPAGGGQGAALTPSDQLTALEGRIDELGDEMKAVRGRLESPKNETRAAPEASAAKTPDGPAALVVVAYALQREFEAGRPYSVEAKALARLGADPAALAALSPFAEKGAPTAAQLKADFAPAAKRIHALEGGDSGDIARAFDERREQARARSSVRRAQPARLSRSKKKSFTSTPRWRMAILLRPPRVFAALPEAAQNEAKDFGAALRARIDAAKAAESLLHGAIAALVATKE